MAYVQSSASLPAAHTHPNTDRFYFSVRLTRPQPARLDNLMFEIKIRASSDSSIRSSSLIVPSGSSVLLKRLHLDATRFMPRGEWKKIQYTVVATPKLGTLNLDSSNILKTGSTFTQTDINKVANRIAVVPIAEKFLIVVQAFGVISNQQKFPRLTKQDQNNCAAN